MVDAFGGLNMSPNFYLPAGTQDPKLNRDYLNTYFQQSFNDILSGFTGGDTDSTDPFGSSAGMDNMDFFSGGQSAMTGSSGSLFSNPLVNQGSFDLVSQLNSYAALIDKEVQYQDGSTVSAGTAEKVVFDTGVPTLLINQNYVKLEDIISVS